MRRNSKAYKAKTPQNIDFEGLKNEVNLSSGPDGTRTRDLCRDRAAF